MRRPLYAPALLVLSALVPLVVAKAAGTQAALELPALSLQAQPSSVVAQVGATIVTRAELEALVIARRAMSEEGRAALRHLAESKLLELVGREQSLLPTEAEVEARLRELDQAVRNSGDPRGLEGQMEKVRLTRAQFAKYLALGLVHERATRRALNLPETTAVSGDQQRLWMDEELTRRLFQAFPPPWAEGLAAQGTGFSVSSQEYLTHLLERLQRDTLREDSRALLLVKAMKERMPDLAPLKLNEAIDEELKQRRAEVSRDPRYKGVPYEELLQAQGVQPWSLRDDPGVVSAALARLWIERSYSEADIERVYKDERPLFDGRHGAAIDGRLLFLRAAQFKNQLNPRNFSEAEAALADLKSRIRSVEDFERFARERSEDASSREQGGRVGWLTPAAEKMPPELGTIIAQTLEIPEGQPQAQGLAGPVRTANGAVLLWLGVRRPAPSYPVMVGHVRRELRRRFIEQCLPAKGVLTAFEP